MSAILSYYHLVKFVKIVSDSSEVKRNNYYTTVAYKLWVSLYTSAIFKTNIQFPVENSIISPMAFMCVAVSAHYESNWKVNSKLEWEMYNKESEMPKELDWYITWYQQPASTYQSIQFSLLCNFQLMIPQTTSMKDDGRKEGV